jgi:hypothetical protein
MSVRLLEKTAASLGQRFVAWKRKRKGKVGQEPKLMLNERHERARSPIQFIFGRKPHRLRDQALHKGRDAKYLTLARHTLDLAWLEIEAVHRRLTKNF